ncbi:YggS family pyridoxal phosphate-dependent enzyme [Peptoniphilus sp. GNH]|nr:pyridoxal phosphate enzyme, YggS family [Clostridiales bacterium KA00134]UHR03109.1 YggS family pyridoxal phosphate-dependent enzyme [Peptoniphilus sp. GNH]
MTHNLRLNYEELIGEIEAAKKKSVFEQDVRLIAVTKTHPVETINEAISLGINDIGENKVQELVQKYNTIGDKVNYHMIGRLQSNKVKDIIGKVKLIHSIDRSSLLEEIDKRSKNAGLISQGLIQINVAGEQQKGGICPNEIDKFIEMCTKYDNIRVRGLMTVAPISDDEDFLRQIFRTMRKIYDRLASNSYENISMDYLSMGMSSDFKLAIEEGANMIRVGSKIFGQREYRR